MEEALPDCNTHAPRPTRGMPRLPAALVGALMAMAALLLAASTASASGTPGAPTGLVVAPGNGKLVAGWNPPEGDAAVDSYTVQYKASTDADWLTAGHSGTGTDTEIIGLTNDTAYDVRVRASNGAGDGPWSPAASAVTHEDFVWAAILTVDVYDISSNGYHTHGCIDRMFSSNSDIEECRTALTEDEFEFDGATYRWTSLYEVTDPWHHAVMGFASSVPSDSGLRTGTLQFGDKLVYLGETDRTRLRWFEAGDGWVVPYPLYQIGDPQFFLKKGQRIPMSLKARIPSNPNAAQLQRGGADDWCPGSSSPATEGINVCRGFGYEGGRPMSLLIKLPGRAPAGGTIINIATGPNQTASSDDYTLSTTGIGIAGGETSGLMTISILEDDEDEGDESIHVYACVGPGCDPLNPQAGEKVYNHGLKIVGTRVGGV